MTPAGDVLPEFAYSIERGDILVLGRPGRIRHRVPERRGASRQARPQELRERIHSLREA